MTMSSRCQMNQRYRGFEIKWLLQGVHNHKERRPSQNGAQGISRCGACPSLSIPGPPPVPCPPSPKDATHMLPGAGRCGQFWVPPGSRLAEGDPCPRGAHILAGTRAREETGA